MLYCFLISILAIQLVKLTLCWDLCNETFENYPGTVLSLYKSLVRPHLGYANTVWASRRICDIEKNRKKATKVTRGHQSQIRGRLVLM